MKETVRLDRYTCDVCGRVEMNRLAIPLALADG